MSRVHQTCKGVRRGGKGGRPPPLGRFSSQQLALSLLPTERSTDLGLVKLKPIYLGPGMHCPAPPRRCGPPAKNQSRASSSRTTHLFMLTLSHFGHSMMCSCQEYLEQVKTRFCYVMLMNSTTKGMKTEP